MSTGSLVAALVLGAGEALDATDAGADVASGTGENEVTGGVDDGAAAGADVTAVRG